ncbi:MAG: integrase arm-type DNA-binding domain-containing protein [Azonexus sp.]
MARSIEILTALFVTKVKKPGLYCDGGSLYLQVSPTGSKSWLFRFMFDRKADNMGLGPVHTVGLADARLKALECRKLLHEGKNPKAERDAAIAASKLANARVMTFRQCAEAYIKTHRHAWKSEKHASQWENTLRDYAYPVIGDLQVSAIDTDLVIKCLAGIWIEKTETATRVRGRIESILDWATTSKYRTGENPARWRGHLKNLLAAPSKVAPVIHHPALPYDQVADFMKSLKAIDGVSSLALEFAILTAARTNEVIGATWEEIDTDKALWIIPANRMKAGREHRVHLSTRALEILTVAHEQKQSNYVFPGKRESKPLSNMALLMTLRRMKRTDLTAHGFRSTFRDWASEVSMYPQEVAEMALAHTVADKVEAAYRRGDLLQKRRQLMEDWARYCETPPINGNVIPINLKNVA